MKSVYLAGKMTGLSEDERHVWRDKASNYLKKLDVPIIDPSRMYDMGSGNWDSQLEIMRYELRAVRNCAVLLVNLKGVSTSVGTMFEIATAYENNIPIIGFNNACSKNIEEKICHPWVLEVLDKGFWTQEEDYCETTPMYAACNYIKKYYFEIGKEP